MDQRRYAAFRYVSLRSNALLCLLLVTPVMLWSSLVGTSASLVAVVWVATVGVPPADRWAAARARGTSTRAATTSVGWGRALAVLVAAVSVTVVAGTGLRALVLRDEWLAGPDPTRAVVAALAVIVLGAAPGVAVLLRARSRGTAGSAPAEDGDEDRGRDPDARPAIPRAVAMVLAAFLGSFNVIVLSSLLPVGEWFGGGPRAAAVAVLVLVPAFAVPWVAVRHAYRPSGSSPSPDRQA
jgi:hypothetical protein